MSAIRKNLLCFILLLGVTSAAFAKEAKNALLIANNSYPDEIGGDLSEPIREAWALKTALESIGFEVSLVTDADRETMDTALHHFKEKTFDAGGIAFFHYGGHAVQVNGINYLIPAHTKIEDESKVRYRCVELDEIMDSMSGKANIAVLDSCRNNPFGMSRGAVTRGLAAVNKRPRNSSIIIYAAGAGQTAQDGVFTPVLTKKITKKDKTIEDILKEVTKEVEDKTGNAQKPAAYTQLKEDIFLAGRTSSVKTLTGSLLINSEFAGTVYLDGEKKGTIKEDGSVLIEGLHTGSYTVEVKSDINKFKTKVKISADTQTAVSIKTGSIKLTSEVSGSIYLNGIYYGTVSRSKPAILAKLGEGTYRVEVHTDSNTFKKEARVRVGEIAAVSVSKPEEPIKKAQTVVQMPPAAEKKPAYEDWYAFGLYGTYTIGINPVTLKASTAFAGDEWGTPFVTQGFNAGITYAQVSLANDFIDFQLSTGYDFAHKNFGTDSITQHIFDVFVFKYGMGNKWVKVHFIGFKLYCLWEKAAYPSKQGMQTVMGSARFGAAPVFDIEASINKYLAFYGEYTPRFTVGHDSPVSFRHSCNLGIKIALLKESF